MVGKGSRTPGPPSSGGKIGLNALIRQGGIYRGLSFCIKPPAVTKDLLAVAACSKCANGSAPGANVVARLFIIRD